MGVSKVILNGTTLMDVTGDTVASSNLLTGYTATGADGETVTGAYTPPTGGGLSFGIYSGAQTDYNGTYTFEENMTWADWIDSAYNTIGAFLSTTTVSVPPVGRWSSAWITPDPSSSLYVYASDSISETIYSVSGVRS